MKMKIEHTPRHTRNPSLKVRLRLGYWYFHVFIAEAGKAGNAKSKEFYDS